MIEMSERKKESKYILEKINSLRANIASELNRTIIPTEELLLSSNWHHTRQKECMVMNHENSLYCSNLSDSAIYVSLYEKNTSFNLLPKNKMSIIPEETLAVYLETAKVGDVTLMIVEYSKSEKHNITSISPNKEQLITLKKNTKFVRIALKIKAKGTALIKNIAINRVKNNNISDKKNRENASPKKIQELKVACILDDFSTQCFNEEVSLFPVYPENWKRDMLSCKPDLLLVESAWHGNNKAWEYLIGKYSGYNNSELIALVKWCKEHNIPTIFWNKEDPFHFDKFIDSAKHFDYIYTTDNGMIPKYLAKVDHENVFPLPFAAQGKRHNPIRIDTYREGKICFAGTYYANRHEERRKDMDMLLNMADHYGLVIYDRNFYRTIPEFKYPEHLRKNIIGSLPYSDIEIAYKKYTYLLNVNSVKQSETMFSRRVFEGMACGTPIISNYSEGIKKIFGNLILFSDDVNEIEEGLRKLEANDFNYQRQALLGVREIFENHTYKQRIETICKNANIQLKNTIKSVTMFAYADSHKAFLKIIDIFNRQSYENKKLHIFITQFENYSEVLNLNTQNISVSLKNYLCNYETLEQIFGEVDYLGYINPENFYGGNYLKDLMIATEYTDAEIIGKATYYSYTDKIKEVNKLNEYTFVNHISMDSCIFIKEIRTSTQVSQFLGDFNDFEKSSGISVRLFQLGSKIFSIDKFNFIRYGESLSEKTKIRKSIDF